MQFTVSTLHLFNKLKFLIGIIKKNDVFPILDNFLFEIKKNELKITATDLENTIITFIDINSEISCKFLVPAKLLIYLIKNIQDKIIVFNIKGNIIAIRIKTGLYQFTVQDSNDYPTIPTIHNSNKIELSKVALLNQIKRTLFATSNDELRSIITGVLIKVYNDRIIFVATDAQVLVKSVQKNVKLNLKSEFIIPKKSLKSLQNILEKKKIGNIILEYNRDNLSFILEKEILFCRLIDGKFPDYESIFPSDKDNTNILISIRNNMLNAIERISIFANNISKKICFELSYNKLKMYADNPHFSHKAIEYISCDYIGSNMTLVFNYIYLKKMLLNLDSEYIIFKISDPNRTIILQPQNESEDIKMIIMPIIINE